MAEALKGRVAVVTGASRGIGRVIAKALAAEGAGVALVARGEKDLAEASREIDAEGENTLIVPTDLTVESDVRDLVDKVRERFGRLDILVNNAGLAVNRPFLETTAEEWDRLMAVNARGPFLLCREAVPLMKAGGGGHVVNIASVVGVKGYPNQAAYTASKHALMGMTKVLAREVKDDGIRVHAVCPGGVATEMVEQMRPDIDASLLMTPEEIADIVLFLVTQRGNAVIDQINVRRAASDPSF